jgi:glycerol-3-phosphate cytidylyltransferase
MSVLYTGGTFDLFHYGHVNFLRKCADIAAVVVVSLNTDEFVAEFKGKAPVIHYGERREALLGCRHVDAVVKNVGGADSKIAIEVIDPDIIAIGDDWQLKDYHAQMGFTPEWLGYHNIELVYLPYTKGISSTEAKRRLLS